MSVFTGWQFGSKIPDSRGGRVTLRRTFWWLWAKQDRKGFKATAIYKKMQPIGFFYGLLIGTVAFTGSSLAGALGIGSILGNILLYSCTVLIGYGLSRFSCVPMLDWLAQQRLARIECGACTFSLAGLGPEPDGCTVCPECGAAWKLGAETGAT